MPRKKKQTYIKVASLLAVTGASSFLGEQLIRAESAPEGDLSADRTLASEHSVSATSQYLEVQADQLQTGPAPDQLIPIEKPILETSSPASAEAADLPIEPVQSEDQLSGEKIDLALASGQESGSGSWSQPNLAPEQPEMISSDSDLAEKPLALESDIKGSTHPTSLGQVVPDQVEPVAANRAFSPSDLRVPEPVTAYVANVKDFGAKGDAVSDDTEAIQRTIDDLAAKGGGVVDIPEGTYLINTVAYKGIYGSVTGGLMMRDNIILRMTPETTLQAIPNDAQTYSVISFYKTNNAHVSGGNLVGDRQSHQGIAGQWGYGIQLLSAKNTVIEKVTARDFWGDGFYVANNAVGLDPQPEHLTFYQVKALNNRRQGLSILSGDHIRVYESEFSSTQGHMPQSGIDVEPEKGHTLSHLEFVGNTFKDNQGFALVLSGSQHEGTRIENVRVENSTIINNHDSIWALGVEKGTISHNVIHNPDISRGVTGGLRHIYLDSKSRDLTVVGNTIYGGSVIKDLGQANQVADNRYKTAVYIRGEAEPGQSLQAHIMDADGLPQSGISYQWYADGQPISAATQSHYQPVEKDWGKAISVRVAFTDQAGQKEEANSLATQPLGSPAPNQPPIFLSIDNDQVMENRPGAVVGTLRVSDYDKNDSHQFAVNDQRFEIVGTTLKLKDDVSLNYYQDKDEAKTLARNSIRLSIAVWDKAGAQFVYENIIVKIQDDPAYRATNTGPSAIALDNRTIPSQTPGAVIAKVTVTDPDAGDQPSFYLSDGRLEIVDGTLKLKAGQSLDASLKSIGLRITAVDQGGEEYSQAFTLPIVEAKPERKVTNRVGQVTIDGKAEVGQTLTAAVTDADGLPDQINYQWFADGQEIRKANQNTLKLSATEVGKTISVEATYLDQAKHNEKLVSTTSTIVVDSPKPQTSGKLGVYVPAPLTDFVAKVTDAPYGAKGDGKTDDTAAIQKAIAEVGAKGGGIVDIPAGTFMIDGVKQLRLQSNVIVRMTDDTTLKVLPNDKTGYSIFRLQNIENAHILGGTIEGERFEHGTTAGESGFGITNYSSRNIVVENVTAKNFWGDGFYVGRYYLTEPQPDNLIFYKVTADGNRRQGMSITDGTNIKIIESTFKNTYGTEPQSGIDIEPNPSNHSPLVRADGSRVANVVRNVDIIRSRFDNNAAYGLIASSNGDSVIENVRIIDSQLYGNSDAIRYKNVIGGQVSGNVMRDAGNKIPYFDIEMGGSKDIIITNNTTYGGRVRTNEHNATVGNSNLQLANNKTLSAVYLDGQAQVGQTLTARIDDANGVPTPRFVEYKWLVDGNLIADASGKEKNAYTVRPSDIGKRISVQVAFPDGANPDKTINNETATSDPTIPVGGQGDSAPTDLYLYGYIIPSEAGGRIGRLSVRDGQDVGDSYHFSLTDDRFEVKDGYLKLKDGVQVENGRASIGITVTDGLGNKHTESFTLTPQGMQRSTDTSKATLTILGFAKAGQTLTAQLRDGDNVSDSNKTGAVSTGVAYQWYADSLAIKGATADSYVLTTADQGRQISVQAAFTDAKGNAESVQSSATLPVRAINPAVSDTSGNSGQPSTPTPTIPDTSGGSGQPNTPPPTTPDTSGSSGQPSTPPPTTPDTSGSSGHPSTSTPSAPDTSGSSGQPSTPTPPVSDTSGSSGQPSTPTPSVPDTSDSSSQPNTPPPTTPDTSGGSSGQPSGSTPSAPNTSGSSGQPSTPTPSVPDTSGGGDQSSTPTPSVPDTSDSSGQPNTPPPTVPDTSGGGGQPSTPAPSVPDTSGSSGQPSTPPPTTPNTSGSSSQPSTPTPSVPDTSGGGGQPSTPTPTIPDTSGGSGQPSGSTPSAPVPSGDNGQPIGLSPQVTGKDKEESTLSLLPSQNFVAGPKQELRAVGQQQGAHLPSTGDESLSFLPLTGFAALLLGLGLSSIRPRRDLDL